MILWSHHFSIHQALFGHFRLCLVILMVYHPFFKHHGFQQDTAGKWLARAMQHRHQGRHETTWGIKNDWGRTICREPWFLHQIYGVPADFPFNEFGDIVHLLSLFRMFSDWFFTIKLNSSRGLSLYHGQSSQCQACWSTFGTSSTPKYGQRKLFHESWYQSVEILHSKVMRITPNLLCFSHDFPMLFQRIFRPGRNWVPHIAPWSTP